MVHISSTIMRRTIIEKYGSAASRGLARYIPQFAIENQHPHNKTILEQAMMIDFVFLRGRVIWINDKATIGKIHIMEKGHFFTIVVRKTIKIAIKQKKCKPTKIHWISLIEFELSVDVTSIFSSLLYTLKYFKIEFTDEKGKQCHFFKPLIALTLIHSQASLHKSNKSSLNIPR